MFYLEVGIIILSAAALYFSLVAVGHTFSEIEKWKRVAKAHEETIKLLAMNLSPEETNLLFSKFTVVDKPKEKKTIKIERSRK